MPDQLTKQSGGGGSSFDESKHPRVPKGQSGGGRFGSSGGGGLAADQKALNRAKGAKRNAGQGGGHKRKPTAVQIDRAALAAAQARARQNPKDKGAKRAVTAAKRKLRHTVAAERKKRKHAAVEARKRARATATAQRKAARAQAAAQRKAQRAAQKGTKTKAPKLPKSVQNAPPSTTLSPATIGKLRRAGLPPATLSSLLRSKGKNAALLNTLAAGASRPFGAWTAGLAKQTVAISDPGSGQTMTIDANRLGMYRKLRRKGLSHEQAMALCKRAGIAKAKYVPLHPPIIHHGKINWVDKVGGLPGPIDAIARVLISHGWDESVAVATAVSQAKKQCATGLAAGGHIHLGGEARATICAAVASWEAKKAAA